MEQNKTIFFAVHVSNKAQMIVECDCIEERDSGYEFLLEGKLVGYAPFSASMVKIDDPKICTDRSSNQLKFM